MIVALDFGMTASKQLPYIYVTNPKCGCSTVRQTLWVNEHALGVAGPPLGPHTEGPQSPFTSAQARWEHSDRDFIFTFVRNPYVRVLSAYLDKITGHRDPAVWGPFAARHGLGEAELSFGQFLRLVASEAPESMDTHWRPQTLMLGTGFVPYDFVGTMETFAADLAHVMRTIFGPDARIEAFAPHRTDAAAKVERYYGPEECSLAHQLYAGDCLSLGYAPDLSQLGRLYAPQPVDPGPIRRWGRGYRRLHTQEYAGAAEDLESLRGRLADPIIDALLVHCYPALLQADGRWPPPSLALVGKAKRVMPRSPELWKAYSRLWAAAGLPEHSLEAELLAIALRDGGSGRKARRYRQHRRALALLRARQGRRAEAVATLRPEEDESQIGRGSGLLGRLTGAVDRVLVHLIAITGELTRRLGETVAVGPARHGGAVALGTHPGREAH